MVTGCWRKLHNEEPCSLYFSLNIIRVIKSRILGWVEHAACMGDSRGAYRNLMGEPEGRRPLGRLSVCGRIILKWIFQKCDGDKNWIDLVWDRDRWRAVVNVVMNLIVP